MARALVVGLILPASVHLAVAQPGGLPAGADPRLIAVGNTQRDDLALGRHVAR